MAISTCASTSFAKLTRYVVKITPNCGPTSLLLPEAGKVFTDVIRVSGLGLGEEGTVTVPEWGVNGMLADGQRTLPALGINFRISDQITDTLAKATTVDLTKPNAILFNMFKVRAESKFDIDVAITDRAFKALFVLSYSSCDFRSLKFEDQELGAAKLGTIMTEFLPYDVVMKACNNSDLVTTGRLTQSGASIVC